MLTLPYRIGHGYDVHRLVEGRKLILGGVEVPYEKGLLGHSDADVLAHAVMDSMLGHYRWGHWLSFSRHGSEVCRCGQHAFDEGSRRTCKRNGICCRESGCHHSLSEPKADGISSEDAAQYCRGLRSSLFSSQRQSYHGGKAGLHGGWFRHCSALRLPACQRITPDFPQFHLYLWKRLSNSKKFRHILR